MNSIEFALVVHFAKFDQTAGFMSFIELPILLPKQSKLSEMSSPNLKK